jgi:hypothetical protein
VRQTIVEKKLAGKAMDMDAIEIADYRASIGRRPDIRRTRIDHPSDPTF